MLEGALTVPCLGGNPAHSYGTAPRHLRRALLPPVLYTVLALVMTWPLAGHLSTHIPGTGGDGPNFLWRLWWVPYALFERNTTPWHTDLLFHPQGASLVFDTLVPFYGVLSYPVQLLAGVVVAYNLLLMASLVAAAYGAYALALHLTHDRRAALFAGVVFGFSPYLLVHLWGHLNLVAVWPLPFFALAVIKALETGSVRWALFAGLALGAVSLLDYQYSAFAVLWALLAAVYYYGFRPALSLRAWIGGHPVGPEFKVSSFGSDAPHETRNTKHETATSSHLRLWAVVLAVWLLLFSPLLLPALQAMAKGEDPAVSNETVARYFSGDLAGFFLPGHPRWGGEQPSRFERPGFQGVGGVEGITYLGWTPLVLALIAVVAGPRPQFPLPRSQRVRERPQCPLPLWERVRERAMGGGRPAFGVPFWTVNATIFALIVLGPTLHVAGMDLGVPLPYALLQHVPYLGTTRVPTRFIVLVYLGLSVLAAFGLRVLLRRLPQRWGAALCGVAVAAVLGEFGVAPLPLRDAAVPDFYKEVASEPGDFSILPLPVLLEAGPRAGSSGRGDQDPQYHQVVHRKPIVYGHVARGSSEMLEYYTRLPGLAWLLNPDAGPPRAGDLDPAAFERMTQELRLRYAVLHRKHYDRPSLGILRDYFENVLGRRVVWDDDELLAFRLDRGQPGGQPAVEDFLRRFQPGVTLVAPVDGSTTGNTLPLLTWQPDGEPPSLFEVQVSRDQWFGRGFLYHETVDGRITQPPFSYRVPDRYPLAAAAVYYWRVRRAEDGRPGPWTAPWRFRTP